MNQYHHIFELAAQRAAITEGTDTMTSRSNLRRGLGADMITLTVKPEAACDNCEWRGDPSELKDIKRYHERVDDDDGEEPAGECPKCGCLAYMKN